MSKKGGKYLIKLALIQKDQLDNINKALFFLTFQKFIIIFYTSVEHATSL